MRNTLTIKERKLFEPFLRTKPIRQTVVDSFSYSSLLIVKRTVAAAALWTPVEATILAGLIKIMIEQFTAFEALKA